VSGVALSHATNPSTRRWDGSDSGLVVRGVGTPGHEIAFTVGEAAPTMRMVSGSAEPGRTIPDNDPTGIASAITLSGGGSASEITVRVSIRHTWIGDLRVELFSPAGQRAVLHNRAGRSQDDIEEEWTSAPPSPMAPLVGQGIDGAWVLRVTDLARRDVGTLVRWSLDIVAV
jgi:subtilisin-like proprotein convertase family protein